MELFSPKFIRTIDAIRATGMWEMVPRDQLPYRMTHYFDRLAIECALTERHRGRLVLYYKALEGEKLMIYDVSFKNVDGIVAEAERRLALLEAGAPARELPACPSWMAKFCSFAPGCGCGSTSMAA